jgi:hypothetical protein
MLKNYIKGSSVIELIEESPNEDNSYLKASIRIIGDTKDWSKLMVELLMAPDQDSDYVVSIRKEYFLSGDNRPTFMWMVLIWGDLFEAAAEIGPIIQGFSQTQEQPEVALPAEPDETPRSSLVRRSSHQTQDGVRTISSVPLPFRRGRRDDPGVTKTLGKRGVGAYVSNVTADGGL